MKIIPLHPDIIRYLERRRLTRKFAKQISLFAINPFYPGLKTELLEPRSMRIWSFRIDRKYRALFIFQDAHAVEIIEVNDHYR